ncbi:MAG: hypothetical protein IJ941_03650 [Clostridia bacterium]|nr:hypothetical protein [Clostridia bacterium]
MTKKNNEDNTKYMPIGMCMGISIGTAIGAAMDNIPVCMAVGLSVGMCIGSLIDAKNRKTDKLQTEDEEEE